MNTNFFLKFINKKKYNELKYKKKIEENLIFYNKKIKSKISDINNKIEKSDNLNFLHSGHLGDLIYSLSLIKELSKEKKCNLLVEINKKNQLPYPHHPSGEVMINSKSFELLLPLLKSQSYLNSVKEYSNENIDVDLNLFREMPFNIIFHSVRWYSHLTGVPVDMQKEFMKVGTIDTFKDKITIVRSPRYRNEYVNYKFLSNFKDLIFVGLHEEYVNLKKEIRFLEFHDCKDFLEMAEIINSSKFFIGNLGFGFSLAEALKKPRLLEACPNFPVLFPTGENAYDFYHQIHFEKYFKILNDL
tara:strand:- start:77 stop:979 length:903 start_codon:yes stop_codon:yes gene_type:complete